MQFTEDERKVIHTDKYHPAISLILPVTPVDFRHRLKLAEEKIYKELRLLYPEDMTQNMLQRLRAATDAIDTAALKKSIAVYISPVLSKVFHLNITVNEKLLIDESFEIRDLVYAQQRRGKMLVLLLSGRHARILNMDNSHTTTLADENIDTYDNDVAARVSHFSDPDKRKEILQEKFIRHIDARLSGIPGIGDLPLFVIGTERLTGHFMQITHNAAYISGLIHGNYDTATPAQLAALLAPETEKQEREKERALLQQLDDAQSASRLDFGIHMVWKTAGEKNAGLLVVEKNYMYPAEYITPGIIRGYEGGTENNLFIKDAVDDVLEKVIACGGEVRFVSDGVLNEYLHIALVRYF